MTEYLLYVYIMLNENEKRTQTSNNNNKESDHFYEEIYLYITYGECRLLSSLHAVNVYQNVCGVKRLCVK